MNHLKKTNLLLKKNLSQFYSIFNFQCFYSFLIHIYIISTLIYEVKPNNYNLLYLAIVCFTHVVRVTSIAARFAIYFLDTLTKLKGDREIWRKTSSSSISICSNNENNFYSDHYYLWHQFMSKK